MKRSLHGIFYLALILLMTSCGKSTCLNPGMQLKFSGFDSVELSRVLVEQYTNNGTVFSGGMTLDGGDIEGNTSGGVWIENTVSPMFVHHLWLEQSINDVDGIRVSALGAVVTDNRLSGESTNGDAWGLDIQSGAQGVVAQDNYIANVAGTAWAYPHIDPAITSGVIGPNYAPSNGIQLDPLTVIGSEQISGAKPTLFIGSSSLAGCLEMGNSDGSAGINYITVLNGTISATTTKPSVCQ